MIHKLNTSHWLKFLFNSYLKFLSFCIFWVKYAINKLVKLNKEIKEIRKMGEKITWIIT